MKPTAPAATFREHLIASPIRSVCWAEEINDGNGCLGCSSLLFYEVDTGGQHGLRFCIIEETAL